jgi:hypothetical protein
MIFNEIESGVPDQKQVKALEHGIKRAIDPATGGRPTPFR